MKKFITLFCFVTATAFAARIIDSGWMTTAVSWGAVRKTKAVGTNELAQFVITTRGQPIALLTQATTAPENWTNKTITATVSADGPGTITYLCGTRNPCGGQQSARLYFTSSPMTYQPYGDEDLYWFCVNPAGVWPARNGTGANLTSQLNPADWTNARGHSGASRPERFATAASHVRQAGLAFGGGQFYDLGLISTNGDCTFHLIKFSAQ